MRSNSIVLCLSFLAIGLTSGYADETETQQVEQTESGLKAIEAVRSAGGQVMEIAQNDNRLDVAFHLADGKITDEHLVPLKQLKGLIHLNLRGTDVTDAGTAILAEIPTLKQLHLEKTKITDAGLAHLVALKELEYLNVYGTDVTDSGLLQLAALPNLKTLYIWQTKATIEGVQKLKEVAPNLQIVPDLVADLAKAKIEVTESKKTLEEAQKTVEEAKKKLEEAKKQLEEAEKKAEQAKKFAEDAQQRLTELESKQTPAKPEQPVEAPKVTVSTMPPEQAAGN